MNVVYAIQTASLMVDGAPILVRGGTHWPADDPAVRAHPNCFSTDPRYGLSWSGNPPAEMSEPPVEAATAAPGERRQVRRG